jgi:predicted nucleic acid-binding protein
VIVLDANILIRAILGRRVRQLLDAYALRVRFLAPNVAFDDMEEHVRRRIIGSPTSASELAEFFAYIRESVEPIDAHVYREYEEQARIRLRGKDEEDWPILTSSLALGCPIWTEDGDFFGTGIATWTTDLVEIFLKQQAAQQTEPL